MSMVIIEPSTSHPTFNGVKVRTGVASHSCVEMVPVLREPLFHNVSLMNPGIVVLETRPCPQGRINTLMG